MIPKLTAFALIAGLMATLAGCDALRGVDPPAVIRNTGLGDSCADFMRLSYPGSQFAMKVDHVDVAKTESGGIALMVVDVQATRTDLAQNPGFLAKDIAARCRFQNGILIQFRWTKGPFR